MAIVRRVESALRGAGATPFVAEYSVAPGESLQKAIAAGINDCDLFVVLWSNHSASSDWVRQELGHAAGKNKRIVPFVLEADAKIPSFLQDTKYIRAYEDVEGGIQAIARQVQDLFATKRKQIEDRNAQGFALVIGVALVLAAFGSKES
jgi:hypothetical protein